MRRVAAHLVSASLLILFRAGAITSAAPPSVDEAFQKFFAARSPQDAAKPAQEIVRSGVSFADALARLKAGRTYAGQAKRGLVRLQRRSIAGDFIYDVD